MTPGISRRGAACVLLAVSLPIAAWVFFEAQRIFRADWASAGARQQVQRWAAGQGPAPTVAQWEDAHADLLESLAITPDDPDLHERLGDLKFVAGMRKGLDEQQNKRQFEAAAGHYEQATALRSTEPGAWAMLALSRQLASAQRLQVQAAWTKAQALGPFEGPVQPVLLNVVLGDWEGATPAMQDWAKGLFDTGNEAARNAINAQAKPFGLIFSPDAPASAASPP